MRFFVFRSGESRRGLRLANRQPRGNFGRSSAHGETRSKDEYSGHPQDIPFLDETEKWRT
jgi:hypothetical protein